MELSAVQAAVTMFLLSSLILSAVKSAEDFNDAAILRGKSPVSGLCAQLIEPSGFPCSEHKTQTEDGFILGLQRVSSSSGSLRRQRGPPVLLIHGLFMAGDAWFLDNPNQSLGFILANRGFDVWVGNVRGTRWCHGHVSLSEKDREFWDWSWQDYALYDLREMIRYIYTVTNSRVFVIGHSQGTIISLAAFTQPDIVEMVGAAALLCPITYLNHITAELPLRLVKMHLDQVFLAMGIHELNFKSDWCTRIMDMICDGHVDCGDLLTSVTGKNCCFNSSRIDFYLEYEPHPTSTKNLNHLFQIQGPAAYYTVKEGLALDFYFLVWILVHNCTWHTCHFLSFYLLAPMLFHNFATVIREGTFAMYDYGRWKNMRHYGQLKPPKFNLSQIPSSLPLWMGYGGNDALADVTDLQHTLKELRSKPELLYLENYGHLDFLVSTRSKEDVYDRMLAFFNSLGTLSSY